MVAIATQAAEKRDREFSDDISMTSRLDTSARAARDAQSPNPTKPSFYFSQLIAICCAATRSTCGDKRVRQASGD